MDNPNPRQFIAFPRQSPDKKPLRPTSREVSELVARLSLRLWTRLLDALAVEILTVNGSARYIITFPIWLKFTEEGNLFEVAELSHKTNTAEMCGRVCPQDHFCEGACTLNDSFGTVAIGRIEKYITSESGDRVHGSDLVVIAVCEGREAESGILDCLRV